jgi:HlyD family secretion protein
VKSAQVALDRARKNLSYTEIHAPIDGVVVERNVDVGQTVAASLSAPQLFLIANDLSQMQILASVDESDIGQIHEGQDVRFTVQAYANQHFTGTVRQVRLQSATTENVVNYTVVVSVANPKGTLLPGMTATVEFLTGSAENALIVPNAALRFKATPEMQAEAGVGTHGMPEPRTAADSAAFAARRDSIRKARQAAGGGQGGGNGGGQFGGGQGGQNGATANRSRASGSRPGFAQLWYVGPDGKAAVARVRTGLSDGQNTEVIGQNIKEGMQVIIGTNSATTTATPAAATTNSPFQQQRRGPGGPGGF